MTTTKPICSAMDSGGGTPVIAANAIGKTVDGRTIWRGLDFVLDRPGMVALTGPSGSGKTTLLNCIGMLDSVTEGSLTLDDRTITKASDAARRRHYRRRIGFLFQNYGLVETWTANQNVAVAARFTGLGRERSNVARDAALAVVGLEGRGKTKIHAMSGGEQQRVALARLVVKRPGLILADEPTSALDDQNAGMVLDLLRRFADDGALVVIATHHDRVIDRCDSFLALETPRRA